MSTASLDFVAFALIVALCYNLAPNLLLRRAVLFVANIAFLYSFHFSAVAIVPLLAFVLIGFLLVKAMERASLRFLFIPALILVIFLFIWLKRYSFIPAVSLLPPFYTVLGLSYIFFRVAHMVVDARDGTLGRSVKPISYFNYTLNFTSLVSGPIQRFQQYAEYEERQDLPTLTWPVAGEAVQRIVVGLFKSIVMAAICQSAHHRALDFLSNIGGGYAVWPQAVLTVVSYTFFLYFNFSGYTDIVVGAARLYMLILPENFDRPFSSLNFLEFWSRWHITLSMWLKTYVYNPLLMRLMQAFPSASLAQGFAVVSFFVTFFLVGVWHGQTSEFLFFGVLQGAGVAGNKLFQVSLSNAIGRSGYRQLSANPVYRALSRGLTFTFFSFSLIWFWGTWQEIGIMFDAAGVTGALCGAFVCFIVSSATLALWENARTVAMSCSLPIAARYLRTIGVTILGVITAAAIFVVASPAPEIVYKTF